MIVTIMQPAYLPWLGFFDRVMSSDLLIFLDHVQIENGRSFTNRNRIRTTTGSQWLTIPIRNSGDVPRQIYKVKIVEDSPWCRKHWLSLSNAYSKTPYFSDYELEIKKYYSNEFDDLGDALMKNYDMISKFLNIEKPIIRSSELDICSSKGDLILDLCLSASATKYISGPFGRSYLDVAKFEKAGIELVFDDYIHPTYTQAHGDFIPYMSVMDVLFNHGSEALDIIASGNHIVH